MKIIKHVIQKGLSIQYRQNWGSRWIHSVGNWVDFEQPFLTAKSATSRVEKLKLNNPSIPYRIKKRGYNQ